MTSHSYDPQRCTAELQERGELEWACAVVARKAFRFVLVVPGGVVLSLAGVAIAVGTEVAWPQVSDGWYCGCRERVLHVVTHISRQVSLLAVPPPYVIGLKIRSCVGRVAL